VTAHTPMGSRPTIERSPADILRLVAAAGSVIAVLVVEQIFGDSLVRFASDLLAGADAVPQWIVDLVFVVARILALVLLGAVAVFALWGRHWRLLATAAFAAGLGALAAALLDRLVDTASVAAIVDPGELPARLDGLASVSGIAAVTAAVTTAAPWTGRRWRRAAWALVIGYCTVQFLAVPGSFDPALGLTTGWLCGAIVLVSFGAPSRRPTLEAVVAGLRSVGLALRRLEPARVDARGSTPYFGVDHDGERCFVKALGADERSADLLFRLYRKLQPRDLGDERPFSSLRRAVEHEALASLVAATLGVRTPALRAFATAEPNGFVLAYRAIDGTSLDRVDPAAISDRMLASVWELVRTLHTHRIAHRDLRLANVVVDAVGETWLIDFGFSELAASDVLLATDVAEVLASSSVCVGPERAVAQAIEHVESPRLAAALDRLHRWALSGATRTALEHRPGVLDDLRHRLAEATMLPPRRA
jgi:glycosyltransferase 2 family protein